MKTIEEIKAMFPVTLEVKKLAKVDYPYEIVANELDKLVKDSPINGVFLTEESSMGTDYNMGIDSNSPKFGQRFEHFYAPTPTQCISTNVDTKIGEINGTYQVVQRSLKELTKESVEFVLDLVNSGNLARGEQMRKQLEDFLKAQNEYELATNQELYLWEATIKYGRSIAIRNTAIGTLLTNLSEGMGLDTAVFKYNNIVDPAKYNQPTPVITKQMIAKGNAKIKGLGYENSLECVHATLADIPVQNVIWVNNSAKELMGNPLDILNDEVVVKPKSFNYASEMSIEYFMEILPNVGKLEILVENSYESNMMNIIRQKFRDAPTVLKWDNDLRWSYEGDLAASAIKQAVKLAGGNVEGVLNFRLAWNEEGGRDNSDLDLWVNEPGGTKIGYSTDFNAGGRKSIRRSPMSGQLDVDNTNPGGKLAVENITFTDLSKMRDGNYKVWVNQYSPSNSKGFTVEIESKEGISTFEYSKPLSRSGMNVQVATVTLKNGVFTVKGEFDSQQSSKEFWGISTQRFHEVSTFMMSPNYWSNKVGNPHYFFLLNDAKNPNSCRALYNEYLNADLYTERKVLQVLGSKLRVPYSDNQLAGLGFSVNQKNSITVKIDSKPIKIKFDGKVIAKSTKAKSKMAI